MTHPRGDLHRYVTSEGIVFLVPFGWQPNDRATRCKAEECREVVLWVETHNGKRSLLNTDGTSHFASCVAGERFRKAPTQ